MAAFVHETDRLLIVTDINLDIICTVWVHQICFVNYINRFIEKSDSFMDMMAESEIAF